MYIIVSIYIYITIIIHSISISYPSRLQRQALLAAHAEDALARRRPQRHGVVPVRRDGAKHLAVLDEADRLLTPTHPAKAFNGLFNSACLPYLPFILIFNQTPCKYQANQLQLHRLRLHQPAFTPIHTHHRSTGGGHTMTMPRGGGGGVTLELLYIYYILKQT